jgi:hypothetical protein
MKTKFVLGVLILILSTCSLKAGQTNSGIEGQVFIGPMCPVVQIGQECPDQPYQAVNSNSGGEESFKPRRMKRAGSESRSSRGNTSCTQSPRTHYLSQESRMSLWERERLHRSL